MSAQATQDRRERQVQELVHRWQLSGDPPGDARRAANQPWRTIIRQHSWPVVTRLASSLLYVALAVVAAAEQSDLWWLWVALGLLHAGVAAFVVMHERRLVDLYPEALEAFEEAGGSNVPWRVDESSAYHPVNLRLADIRRRGGPTGLQRWATRAPMHYAIGLTAAWSVPVLLAVGIAVVATGEWVWLVVAAVVVPPALLGVRALRSRAETTAAALDHWRDASADAP